jgi:hypothetical protein
MTRVAAFDNGLVADLSIIGAVMVTVEYLLIQKTHIILTMLDGQQVFIRDIGEPQVMSDGTSSKWVTR